LRRCHADQRTSRDARHADLRGIARKFLAERERGRILQMGAADLDDIVPALALASSVASSRSSAGSSRRWRRSAAAMCIAVGKLSFEDWPC
jgi:hypothetical protein